MRKKKCFGAVLAMVLLILTGTACGTFGLYADAAADQMKIVAIDLGEENTGESAMISDGSGRSLLVDSGDNKTDALIEWLDNNGYKDKEFDTLVTHWHDDHAGNTAELIEKYNIKTVYLPPADYVYSEDTKYYKHEQGYVEKVLSTAEKKGTEVVYLEKGQIIDVGCVKGEVLTVNSSLKKENWYDVQYFNNQSAVIMFTGGGVRYLTAGDIQAQTEKRLLRSGVSLKADIFKLNHHGYDRSNTQAFIEAVNPTYSYFTSYKATKTVFMPDDVKDSVSRMEKISHVLSTHYNGTIIYTCSGGNIDVSADRNIIK